MAKRSSLENSAPCRSNPARTGLADGAASAPGPPGQLARAGPCWPVLGPQPARQAQCLGLGRTLLAPTGSQRTCKTLEWVRQAAVSAGHAAGSGRAQERARVGMPGPLEANATLQAERTRASVAMVPPRAPAQRVCVASPSRDRGQDGVAHGACRPGGGRVFPAGSMAAAASQASLDSAPRILRLVAECSRSRARAGELRLPHGTVATPVFMPVGTQATMKGITTEQLDALGCRICLGNTYHLGLRPVGGEGRQGRPGPVSGGVAPGPRCSPPTLPLSTPGPRAHPEGARPARVHELAPQPADGELWDAEGEWAGSASQPPVLTAPLCGGPCRTAVASRWCPWWPCPR